MDFANKYPADLNGPKFLSEVFNTKTPFPALDENFYKVNHLEILPLLFNFDLTGN